jgi:hypothetical protein
VVVRGREEDGWGRGEGEMVGEVLRGKGARGKREQGEEEREEMKELAQ